MVAGNEQCDGEDVGGWDCWTVAQQEHGTLGCTEECTFDTSTCHTCGNGTVEGSEPCDGSDLGANSCSSLGYVAGDLTCTPTCELDTYNCAGPPTCGNGVLDTGEQCEGGDLGEATCESLGLAGTGLTCSDLCVLDTSGCLPAVCGERSVDNPHGRVPLQRYVHPDRDLQIAVHSDAVIVNMDPVGASIQEAAVAFDLVLPDHAVAGFVIMRTMTTNSVAQEAAAVAQTLSSIGTGPTDPVQSVGTLRSSHDGYENAAGVSINVTIDPQDLGSVRDAAVAALLGRATSELTLSPDLGYSGQNVIFRLTTQRRADVVLVMGGVVTLADYEQISAARNHLEDAANGSGLARSDALTQATCDETSMDAIPKADIIWVLDESASMDVMLQSLSNTAASMFQVAALGGLDFRMGITDVHIGNNGVFCTAQNQSNDFFLSSSDLNAVQACMIQPWGSLTYENGTEHGITQGYNAIVNHLPRAEAPNRIRPDAALVLIYYSNEAAQEIQSACGASQPWDPACLQAEVQPTIDLLTAVTDPEGEGVAHAVVGPSPWGCSFAGLGGGYIDIAQATGGQVHGLCQSYLEHAARRIIEDTLGRASSVVLAHRPISASLAITLVDSSVEPPLLTPLPRSRGQGFAYNSAHNSIVFYDQALTAPPYQLTIAYERWTAP